jgi:type IV secretion system protein VirD4
MSKVQMLLDEAAVLGPMPQIQDALDTGRGFGCHLTLIYQSPSQLKRCFPDGQDANVLANVTQVFFAVNELQTAEYVSNRLGEKTIVVESGGISRGTSRQYSAKDNGSYSTSTTTSNNWNQHGRKLAKPEEILALSPRTAITFAPGVPPICTQLIRYYEGWPDSFWQQTKRGLRAVLCSLLVLGTSVVAANSLAESYQYMLKHPPVRAVPTRRFH